MPRKPRMRASSRHERINNSPAAQYHYNFQHRGSSVEAVTSTPNAIGYMDAARLRGNVRMALKL
jgi:hypothetical protein